MPQHAGVLREVPRLPYKVYVVHNRGVNHSVRGVVYTSRAVVAELSELRVLSPKVIG